MMVRTKIFVKEDTKMLYTEKEKHEIERVKEVFAEHLRQSPDFELLWSDKVGYVWLTIGVNPLYVDTGIRIESAADLCGRCLDDVATDVLYTSSGVSQICPFCRKGGSIWFLRPPKNSLASCKSSCTARMWTV